MTCWSSARELGVLMLEYARRTSDPARLDMAIGLLRQACEDGPVSGEARLVNCCQLATALCARFDVCGRRADLDAAISVLECVHSSLAVLGPVPSSPSFARSAGEAASAAVHRKAEGRPDTGRIRAVRQRDAGVPPDEVWASAVPEAASQSGDSEQAPAGEESFDYAERIHLLLARSLQRRFELTGVLRDLDAAAEITAIIHTAQLHSEYAIQPPHDGRQAPATVQCASGEGVHSPQSPSSPRGRQNMF